MKLSVEAWHRFRNLSVYSRSLVLEAAVLLFLTWIGLRIAGLRYWSSLLDLFASHPLRRASVTDPAALGVARAIARFHEAAARHIPIQTNCLERALVLCCQLQRRGLPARLQIGARKDDGRFEAHAWVEFSGAVLNDWPSSHLGFTPFARSLAPLGIETL